MEGKQMISLVGKEQNELERLNAVTGERAGRKLAGERENKARAAFELAISKGGKLLGVLLALILLCALKDAGGIDATAYRPLAAAGLFAAGWLARRFVTAVKGFARRSGR